jgi:hypothetical protein
MDEHPRAPRRRMFKAGTIEFGGGGMDCTIRNISETGAALEVVTPLFIPDRFTLFVPTEQLKRKRGAEALEIVCAESWEHR